MSSVLLLQPHVQPQASLMEGAATEARGFWSPPPKRVVRNSDRAHQSPTFPAGRRSHLLYHGPGDRTTGSFAKAVDRSVTLSNVD